MFTSGTYVLLTILASLIVANIFNYILLLRDLREKNRSAVRKASALPIILQLVFIIIGGIAGYYMSKDDSEQKNRIEHLTLVDDSLSRSNDSLLKKLRDLQQTNNEIASGTQKLSEENGIITEKVMELTSLINKRAAKESEENAQYGRLYLKDKLKKDSGIHLFFGGDVFTYEKLDKYKKGQLLTPIAVNDNELFKLGIVDNKLMISLTAFDLRGNWVVEISNNWWRRNPCYTGKFNYNDTALEIIDNEGNLVLNLILNTNGLIYNGYFMSKGSNSFLMASRITNNWKFILLNEKDARQKIAEGLQEVNKNQIFRYTGKNWIHHTITDPN
jgi:hypothetical protein